MDSAIGQTLLERRNLSLADVHEALERYIAAEQRPIGTVIGITQDGLFAATRRHWHSGLPDAFAEPLIFVPWVLVLELLRRVPDGSTGRLFGKGGTRH